MMTMKFSHNPEVTCPHQAVYLQQGQVYYCTQGPRSSYWEAAKNEPPNLVDVVMGASGVICALDTQGFVYLYDMIHSKWSRDPGHGSHVVSISTDENNALWAVNDNGQVYRLDLANPNARWDLVFQNIPGDMPYWEYEVKPGDYLYKIVWQQYGTWGNDRLTSAIIQQIKILNPIIVDINRIQMGWKLKMPPK